MAFRRKWASEAQGEWKVHWINGATFKFELEGQGLTDSVVEEWGPWMDTQFELRFPDGNWPSLTAAKLSFSHNDIGDHGIQTIVDYLNRRKISVQLIKFFKNSIGDAGAWAIGELLANSPEPVQEVHLSHNRIGNEGACAIFEAIARSKRYPYKTSDRNSRGIMPVWLRMEYNFIHWGNIAPRLEQHKVSWIAADSRENWVPKDTAAPMVCMHHSYKNQTPAESSSSGQGRESAASRKASEGQWDEHGVIYAGRFRVAARSGGFSFLSRVVCIPFSRYLEPDQPRRGRAELTRLIFAAGQVPFEDERVSRQEQQRRKSSGELPFGQFPTLSVDGRVFAQSYSIAKYAAKLAGLLSSDHLAALEAEGVVDMTEDVRSKFVPIRYLPVPPEAKLAKYEEFFTTTLP
ncbi:unnamed protein product [Polarella glacialis]|uniref:GST N-terminal domain-containing protein n=1 Tax=Polarella glacialis TaxID=89957 RepID=A0A813KYN5_POLGL|nr:unnamed protein product [Polarella glacialis]